MRDSGRLSAAIEILTDFEARHVPLKTAIADWGRSNRYAGAKDRAWISGLCLDVLRRRQSLLGAMGIEGPINEANSVACVRAMVLGAYHWLWKVPLEMLAEQAAEEPHGPGALSPQEHAALKVRTSLDSDEYLDVPGWVTPMMERAFGEAASTECRAMAARASVDLRMNTLKSTPEKTLQALKAVRAESDTCIKTAARIAAPDPSKKAPAVTVIPAFNKGWVEVQDLGSQLAALAAGEIAGKQVLDFCAGGGGKTLALAALMNNTGQLHAYDIDAHRLKPLYARAKRAGLRNLQVRTPDNRQQQAEDTMPDLVGKMDVVFVDAPCTGAGTWRRHPDTKWRLTEQQLDRRKREQDKALQSAAGFVKPGGCLVYVTCSVFKEENEDRLEAFLSEASQAGGSEFMPTSTLASMAFADNFHPGTEEKLREFETSEGYLRLSPYRTGTDGFFIACLIKEKGGT